MSLQISGWAFVFDFVFELRVCVWREGKLKKTEREQSTQQQKMNVYVLYLCVWERENEVVSSLLQLIQIREFAYGCLNYNSWWLIYTHTHTHICTHTHTVCLWHYVQLQLVKWSKVALSCERQWVVSAVSKWHPYGFLHSQRLFMGNNVLCVTTDLGFILFVGICLF